MSTHSTPKNSGSNYRWYVLALATLTLAFAMAIPMGCMPVLFQEISKDLDLSLVQIGAVWGMVGLSGIFLVLIGGLLGDKFGVKRTLSTACFLTGLAGAARGLSGGFGSLAVTMFLFGIPIAIIPIIGFKPISIWFSERQLGLANAILCVGVAVGLMVTSMISATIMSPLLGGWRNVMFLYGAIAFAIGIPWLLTRSGPSQVESSGSSASVVPFRQALSHVVRNRNVWLLGFISIGQMGCAQGMHGYLALYLREIGWMAASADGTLAAYAAASLVGVIPITLLSNRLGSRKIILFATMLMTAIGTGLLSVVSGSMVWVAVIIAGTAWDGFMACLYSIIMETEGVGATYTGTAVGLVHTISRLSRIISPVIGMSLATINPSLAFVFWAAMAAVALVGVYFIKETGGKRKVLQERRKVA